MEYVRKASRLDWRRITINQQQYTQLIEQLEQLCHIGAFEEMRQLASTHYEQAIEMHNDFIELQMLRYMMMASANLGQYDHLLHFFERYEYLCHALQDEQCLLFFNIYLTIQKDEPLLRPVFLYVLIVSYIIRFLGIYR